MAVFRFLAAVFLMAATISVVVDATPLVYGAGPFHATSLGDQWDELAPKSYAASKSGIQDLAGSWLWDGVIAPVLAVPTFLGFGALAALSGYVGRRRRSVRIFVN